MDGRKGSGGRGLVDEEPKAAVVDTSGISSGDDLAPQAPNHANEAVRNDLAPQATPLNPALCSLAGAHSSVR